MGRFGIFHVMCWAISPSSRSISLNRADADRESRTNMIWGVGNKHVTSQSGCQCTRCVWRWVVYENYRLGNNSPGMLRYRARKVIIWFSAKHIGYGSNNVSCTSDKEIIYEWKNSQKELLKINKPFVVKSSTIIFRE